MGKERPEWTTLDVPEIVGWAVSVQLAAVDGAEEIVGLRLEPRAMGQDELRAAKVTSISMRRLPMRAINDALDRLRIRAIDTEWTQVALVGRKYPAEFYEMVASMYRMAVEEGVPPAKFIGQLTDASPDAIAKWIGKARRQGFLGPALKGVAGEGPVRKAKR